MTWRVIAVQVLQGVHPMSTVPLPSPQTKRFSASRRRADRFAPPPWDTDSPAWQAIDQKLPPHHLARRIDQAVDQLDLTPLFASYAATGSRAHRPDLLL